ncbi:monovalent cation/H+ antiporter subunit D family protein [Corynebacterium striatum]|uniref:monovalent cation/H+ antiporter subunit D family protein n=1 Tax=Corynebacterium striatum TaxID=43770 RepID=UPI00191D876B|nr:monovalent cation/H+ antiporter subunit D family protein [Corynebacterium striatum]MCG7249239.1 monovalent cation/H+ antiporter subunit D family protein [Corynebacterium striatum]QQU79416.1 monovalent cation/H+ antiporter subunit D family protein [Corynebacterium striatum]HAT1180582.1 monovalent cation/H+ antiporter subunit D family protein [Corynebacterium striatum]HAT1360136.1 monovalent cation/H+ antiporter subunit D family protein [Corynebacterium striatum]HBC8574453.1 monovalent cation
MAELVSALLPLFPAVPLVAAALALLAPWRGVRDSIMLVIPGVGIFAGFALLLYTMNNGVVAHTVGLYPGNAGIAFAADTFSALMIVTTMIVAFGANWFAIVGGETKSRYYASLTLILVTGVCGTLLTADLFNFFVFIEVMLLPSYGLITMSGTWSRLAAGRAFVLVNLFASTLLVVGVGYIYSVTGVVNLAALESAAAGNGPVTVASGIVVIAIAAKAGVFPVQSWLPRTYPGTSAAVMGLFSGLHTKVAVYMLYRLWVHLFDMDQRWGTLIIVVMIVSMIIGAFGGMAENSIRRVLGYQMLNGMPFILVMMAFTTHDPQRALGAGILYTIHHMLTVGSLILASGAIEETYGTGLLSKLSGLARRDPIIAWIFAAGAFSVVGFPPFSGMWGKVLIVVEIARTGDLWAWIVIAVIIIASFAAFLSMLRVWREVFWGKDLPKEKVPAELIIRKKLMAPSAALIMGSLTMFILAGPVIDVTMHAAEDLLDTEAYTQAVLGDAPVALPDIDSIQGGR